MEVSKCQKKMKKLRIDRRKVVAMKKEHTKDRSFRIGSQFSCHHIKTETDSLEENYQYAEIEIHRNKPACTYLLFH